jgi:predicted metalloprotease
VGIRCADHATPSIRKKKLALTSPTSGGRSVGIGGFRTKSQGVVVVVVVVAICICIYIYIGHQVLNICSTSEDTLTYDGKQHNIHTQNKINHSSTKIEVRGKS